MCLFVCFFLPLFVYLLIGRLVVFKGMPISFMCVIISINSNISVSLLVVVCLVLVVVVVVVEVVVVVAL